MKGKFFLSGSLLLAFLGLAACTEKDYYNPGDDEKKTTDLVVPDGFDWETSENVSLAVTSSVETVVDVFLTEECNENDKLATISVPSEENVLSVPKGTEKVYIRYPKTTGDYGVIISSLIQTRAESGTHVRLPEDAGAWGNGHYKSLYYYPSADWGTLLFEDNWPGLGDYDFNDMALWYKIQLYTVGTGQSRRVEAVMISLRLNAIGGTLPYEFCLQTDNLGADQIVEMEYPYANQKDAKVELISTGGDPAVLSFGWENLKGSNGGLFYNTEKEYQVSPEELKQVTVMIYLDSEKRMDIFTHDSFNFFLRNTEDGREIHLRGYKPTSMFYSAYEEFENANANLSKERYYCTTDGFVWGLKVPKGIDHAQEKVDFRKAYKLFEEWVTSGGKTYPQWYNEQSGKEYRIDVGKMK